MNIRSGLSILGLAITLACGGGGGGGDSSSGYTTPPPSGPPANTVYVGGTGGPYGGTGTMSFDPAVLTVPAGTAVTFSWQGGTHTVTSYTLGGSPTFTSSGAQSSGTYVYTFNTAGTYYYYCTFHGNFFGTAPNATQEATGMAGKIVVQ
jgi:plastocyanin